MDDEMVITYVNNHVEVYQNNEFVFSEDTVDEAINIIKQYYDMCPYIIV